MTGLGARRLATLLAGLSLGALVATLALMAQNVVGRPLTDYGQTESWDSW